MKRTRLGPGEKSLERGSTFAKPRSELARVTPLSRGRRRERGRPTDEQIERKWGNPCWLAQFSDRPCRGTLRLCHLIPKQRLRAAGVPESDIWDERVVANGCDGHHDQLDVEAIDRIEIPRDQLPPGLEEYAAEHDLTSSLDRDYGTLEDVQTAPVVEFPIPDDGPEAA